MDFSRKNSEMFKCVESERGQKWEEAMENGRENEFEIAKMHSQP